MCQCSYECHFSLREVCVSTSNEIYSTQNISQLSSRFKLVSNAELVKVSQFIEVKFENPIFFEGDENFL